MCVDHAKAELEHIQQQQHLKKQQSVINSTPRSSLNTNFMLQGNHNNHPSVINQHMPQLIEGASNNVNKHKSFSVITDSDTCARVRFFVGNPKASGLVSGTRGLISSLPPQQDPAFISVPHTQAAILRRTPQIHRQYPSNSQYDYNGDNECTSQFEKVQRRGAAIRRGISQPRRDSLSTVYINSALPYHVGQHHSQPYPNAPKAHRQLPYNISHTSIQMRAPSHFANGPPPLIPSPSAIVINNNHHHNYSQKHQHHYGPLKKKKIIDLS